MLLNLIFLHLKFILDEHMKFDIQIVKLRQKTETHFVKNILLHSLGIRLT